MLLRYSVYQWVYIGLGVSVLLACSSKSSVMPAEPQSDNHWYCTPKGDDDWLCQESDGEFMRLAQQSRTVIEEPEHSTETEPQLDVEDPVSPGSPVTQDPAESQSFVEDDKPELAEPVQNSPSLPAEPVEKELSKQQEVDTESEISAWIVQLAAYTREDGAIHLSNQIPDSRYYQTQVKGQRYYTVILSGFASKAEAQVAAQQLQTQNLGLTPWVRRGDALRQVIVP